MVELTWMVGCKVNNDQNILIAVSYSVILNVHVQQQSDRHDSRTNPLHSIEP